MSARVFKLPVARFAIRPLNLAIRNIGTTLPVSLECRTDKEKVLITIWNLAEAHYGWEAANPVAPSVLDGVRTTKDETDCLGAALDGVDGRRLQTRKIGQ